MMGRANGELLPVIKSGANGWIGYISLHPRVETDAHQEE
jgi:hypothetical protein